MGWIRRGTTGPDGHATAHVAALVGGALGISFAPIFTRLAMQQGGVGPTAAAFWRMALALPVLMILWRSGRPGAAAAIKTSWLVFALPGALFAADLAVWHASLNFTTVANSTLLANCATIIVSVTGWLYFDERPTWRFALGAALALLGVAVVLKFDVQWTAGRIRGDALALAAAVFYGAYLVCIKVLRRRYDVLHIMTASSLSCAVVLGPAAWALGEQLVSATWTGWVMLVLLALVSHCVGQGFIAYALAHLPASFSAVTLLVQPVGATLWGWLILGEALAPLQALGAGLVLAGILIARLGSDLGPRVA